MAYLLSKQIPKSRCGKNFQLGIHWKSALSARSYIHLGGTISLFQTHQDRLLHRPGRSTYRLAGRQHPHRSRLRLRHTMQLVAGIPPAGYLLRLQICGRGAIVEVCRLHLGLNQIFFHWNMIFQFICKLPAFLLDYTRTNSATQVLC